jgi:methyl-accepting chemotaxis protein
MQENKVKIPWRHQLRTRMIFSIVLPGYICLSVLDLSVLLALLNQQGISEAVKQSIMTQNIFIFVGCLVVLTASVLLTARFVVGQIRILTMYNGNLAEGNTDFKVATARRKDEFGTLGRSVRDIQLSLKKISMLLNYAAKDAVTGNLSVRVDVSKYPGDFGHIMDGTNKTNDSVCALIRGIRDAAVTVSEEAQQLSAGAQNVAQGSTEQAAAIQEISATVGEVLERTKDNAENADKTRVMYEKVSAEAEKGSEKMRQLLESLDAINKASAYMSNVIKLIEDIAFQTNILALNAAVEAARAGAHGKGFAVVAAEVKNLANKSANAAKETDELLNDSMRKSKQSFTIGEEMEKTLADILAGISASAGSIREIDEVCELQVKTIEQLNSGLEQISQIVQSNTATAEESAASSQQMAAQSAMLMEMVSKYRIEVERIVAKPSGFNENDY